MRIFRYIILMLSVSLGAPSQAEETYDEDTILQEATDFFGEATEGVAKVIEKIFEEQGRPNAYIKGNEGSGALVVGARYGDGTLFRKAGGSTKVHWTGPSIGFDAGGNLSKVFVLVYHLDNTSELFQRFPAVEGGYYFVGGVSANYHQSGNVILAPIRLGVGFRAGVNAGYMKYSRERTWNPF